MLEIGIGSVEIDIGSVENGQMSGVIIVIKQEIV